MILDEIIAWKRQEIAKRKKEMPLDAVKGRVRAGSARGFERALVREGRLSILAEIKRASPSAGVIREDADAGELAAAMEEAGAHALSVLTDAKYFRGSMADLSAARSAVEIPVLQKDFVIDEYQVYEAAAAGADAVLLIVRILTDAQLAGLFSTAKAIGLGCLVEAHTAEGVKRAVSMGAKLLGINNRDLATFKTDISTTTSLMNCVPADVKVVSQSGISRPEEAKRLFDAGVCAIQVGEGIMRADDPGAKIKELLSLVN